MNRLVNTREIKAAAGILILLGALLLPTARTEAAITVVDIPHTVVSKAQWAYARYQKAQQLYNDYLKLRTMAEYVWRDPAYAIGEHIYLNSLRLANADPGYPPSTLESFAYGVDDIETRVRKYYSGLTTFEPQPDDHLYPLPSYGELVRRRAEGRRELSANVIGTLRDHRDQLVDGAIAKREVLNAVEAAQGTTQQLEALAHLAAMQVEEQMVLRELQMAQANMAALGHLEANARHAESMLAYEETFGGSRDQPLVASQPRGLYPWSR